VQIAPEDVQEYRFVVVKGAKPGATVSFGPELRAIQIGRAVDNDVVLSDASVSRRHVRVDVRADGCFVCDLGSSTGAEKMGFRLGRDPEPLASGDELRLGDTILRFEIVARRGALKKAAAAKDAAAKPAAPATAGPSGSALDKALARFGLRSKRSRIVGLLALVLIVALLLWPSSPGLPPQSSRPLPIDYGRAVGYGVGDDSHLDGAVFEVPANAEGVALYFELAAARGAAIRTAKSTIAEIEPSTKWAPYLLFVLPRAIAGAKGPRLVFDHLGYSAKQGDVDPATVSPWGVRRMWLAQVADAPSSPSQLVEELRALEDLVRRMRDAPSGLYAAAAGTSRAVLGLMKLGGESSVLVPVRGAEDLGGPDLVAVVTAAREELEQGGAARALPRLLEVAGRIQGELARDHRKLSNQLELARKRKDGSGELTTLAQLVKLVPDPVDPRRRALNEAVGTLKGRRKAFFEEALVKLGEQPQKRK
jgi:hypothetical protein